MNLTSLQFSAPHVLLNITTVLGVPLMAPSTEEVAQIFLANAQATTGECLRPPEHSWEPLPPVDAFSK